jgi:RND family efflux transporter MFP subunit
LLLDLILVAQQRRDRPMNPGLETPLYPDSPVVDVKFRPAAAIVAGLCFIAILLLTSCSSDPEARSGSGPDGPVPARFFTVQEQVMKRRVQAVGSLYPIDESTISSEVEARVDKVLVDVGDPVREGQVLVELSPTELQYEVDRQRATVAEVRARLGIGPDDSLPRRPDEVAFVQRAAADLFDAEQKFKRADQLFRDRLISQEQLDEAASRYKSSRAALDLAVQEVSQLKAQLQSSEVARRLAEKKLADATIRAPFPGFVQARRVSPGEYLRLQGPVMVVVRTDTLRARLAVPERWAGAVKTGSTVDLRVEAYPGEVFRGHLERINPSVSPQTRTFEIEALVPNSDGRLKPGFFVEGSLPSEIEERALVIPPETINYRYGVYKVFLVSGDRVEEREVKPGQQQESGVEILEGLKAGDRVAVAAKGQLADGELVREETPRPATGE